MLESILFQSPPLVLSIQEVWNIEGSTVDESFLSEELTYRFYGEDTAAGIVNSRRNIPVAIKFALYPIGRTGMLDDPFDNTQKFFAPLRVEGTNCSGRLCCLLKYIR